jgi:GNAT superfamily N-acetyltransferase
VSERFGEVEEQIVTAAGRRHGASARLVAAVEAWTRGRAIVELRVRARTERGVAHRLHQGRGFARPSSSACSPIHPWHAAHGQ